MTNRPSMKILRLPMIVMIVAIGNDSVLTRSSCASPLTLDNGTVKVSVDTAYGGAITYLSQSGSTTNLVNIHDFGREVQQAYYSGPANFLPPGAVQYPYYSSTGWPWNPTQAGDVFRNAATVLASANTGRQKERRQFGGYTPACHPPSLEKRILFFPAAPLPEVMP
jgi:hypothetical protein